MLVLATYLVVQGGAVQTRRVRGCREVDRLRASVRLVPSNVFATGSLIQRSKLGERVGRLADVDMVRLGRAIVVFSGLAGS